jgi:hypothetical protein
LRGFPLREEFVYLGLAVEIEPEYAWAHVAMPPWSSPRSKVKPNVLTYIVGCGFVDVSRGNLRDGRRKRHKFIDAIVAQRAARAAK